MYRKVYPERSFSSLSGSGVSAEREYMRALAELDEGIHRSGEVAKLVGKTTHQLGPVRDTPVRKGMVYSPAHGDIAHNHPAIACRNAVIRGLR